MQDIDSGPVSDCQIHERITIKLPEFDRDSSRRDRDAKRRRIKASSGAVKNQYLRALLAANTHRDIELAISRSEFAGCQRRDVARQRNLLFGSQAALTITGKQTKAAITRGN